jgi:hypothetical protein
MCIYIASKQKLEKSEGAIKNGQSIQRHWQHWADDTEQIQTKQKLNDNSRNV